ncbi:MAG TPA: protein kinase [Pyrinomonadaceae bacterium]|nr:protein kinase [Pyrinomonadaceae bacterium]
MFSTGSRLGPYEIISSLGAGGMGEVYRARDTRLGREVALKILPSSFSDNKERLYRFEQEARAAGALNHPNILSIHDVGADNGAPYVVFELLEGETLRQRIGSTPLPQRKAIDYALQIAHGLAAAHDKRIIHRDLKPENLFITKDGRVKILDFGLAKLVQVDPVAIESNVPTRQIVSQPGMIVGTVGYMSPEQVRGNKVDHRSDIFSVGAIFYEMLSGRRAFHGDSAVETMSAILKEEPPDLSATNRNIAPALQRIVHHCLEKNPDERFQTARDLAFNLQALTATSDQSLSLEALPGRFRAKDWERLGWIALSAVLLVSTVTFAILHFRNKQQAIDISTFRFTISPPEQMTFAGGGAISPDGRSIVLRITDSTGKPQLWLQSLDSFTAHPIADTEGVGFFFWSPDSRNLGFFANGKLKRVDVTAGVPQTLCEVTRGSGGTWSRDGIILFGSIADGLYRVSASGGNPTPATRLDHSLQETSHRFPYFLPDGKHFLFESRTSHQEGVVVYVGSLNSNEKKRLLTASSNAKFALPGYLLFVRDTTLMAQQFDPSSFQLSGEPQRVVEQINVGPGPGGVASFSVSATGILVYWGWSGNTQLNWFDRTGKLLSSLGPPLRYGNLSLSRDEKHVAVTIRDPQSATTDIWILDPVRSSRFTLTDAANEVLPIWSPDGTRLVFSSDRKGGNVWNVYEKPTSGAGEEQLILDDDQNKAVSDWSNDGRYVIFSEDNPTTKTDLWLLPMAGDRKPTPFLQKQFDEDDAKFSADGRFIAYSSNASGHSEVYVQTFPASGLQWQVSSKGGAQPRWRRDGKELFYISPSNQLMAVDLKLRDNSLEVGIPKVLFQAHPLGFPGPRNMYAVSADGQRFLINSLVDTAPQPLSVIVNWPTELKK